MAHFEISTIIEGRSGASTSATMTIRDQHGTLTRFCPRRNAPVLWRRPTSHWPCPAVQSISLPDSGAGSESSLGPECPPCLRSSLPQHGSSPPSAGGHLTTSGAAGGTEIHTVTSCSSQQGSVSGFDNGTLPSGAVETQAYKSSTFVSFF